MVGGYPGGFEATVCRAYRLELEKKQQSDDDDFFATILEDQARKVYRP